MTRINTATHNAARLSLGRLIREYQREEIPSQTFRDIIYAMNTLLGFFKLDVEVKTEERLVALEDAEAERNQK